MADPSYLETVIQQVQTPEAQAFLATLAGPESTGRYDVRFNGSPTGAVIPDLSRHPQMPERIPEGWPEAGRTSDAAGAYQMLGSTWKGAAKNLGLPGAETGDAPYYPFYQQLGAWDVANRAFKQVHPNGDMLATLQSGNVEPVMEAMRSSRQWDTANPKGYFGNLAKQLQTAQGPSATVSDARPPMPEMNAPQASDDDVVRAFIMGTLPSMQPKAPVAGAETVASQPPPPLVDQPPPASGMAPGIAALAAAATNAPPVSGQGAPVTRDQLAGTTPPPAPVAPPAPLLPAPAAPSGVDALAAAGRPATAAVTPPATAAPSTVVDPQVMIRALTDQYNALPGLHQGVPISPEILTAKQNILNQIREWQQLDPAFVQQSATAKATGEAAGALPYAGPKAAAEAGAKLPFDTAMENLKNNNTIKAELAKSGMELGPDNVIRPIGGYADVTQANERAKTIGAQGPKINEIRPGTIAATGDAIAANGGMMVNTGEIGERGKQLADRGKLYLDEANGARSQNFLLDNMLTASRGFTPGAGADEAAFLKSLVNSVFPEAFSESLPSHQEFTKYAIQNAREQTRSMGAGEAASVFQTNIQANPNAKLTRKALEDIMGGMHALNDYKIARDGAAADWRTQHKSMEGFDNSAWVRENPIMRFKLPYMSDDDLKKMRATMSGRPQ